jgi:hypothetical protein
MKMIAALARGERDKFRGTIITADYTFEDKKQQAYSFKEFSVVELDCLGLFQSSYTPAQVEEALAGEIVRVAGILLPGALWNEEYTILRDGGDNEGDLVCHVVVLLVPCAS